MGRCKSPIMFLVAITQCDYLGWWTQEGISVRGPICLWAEMTGVMCLHKRTSGPDNMLDL